MKPQWARILNGAATAVLVACALATTGMVAQREFGTDSASPEAKQRDWLTYANAGHRVGPENAPAVLVAFIDYQCPWCRRMEERIRHVRDRYATQFAVVYRHYPLVNHPYAASAALAVECAGAQGRFESMHTELLEHQDSIGTWTWTVFAARAAVADTAQLAECVQDEDFSARIAEDLDAIARLGTQGTPVLLMGGRRYRGAVPEAKLDSLVRAAIEE